jgi:lysophospholipase L1-like esterase
VNIGRLTRIEISVNSGVSRNSLWLNARVFGSKKWDFQATSLLQYQPMKKRYPRRRPSDQISSRPNQLVPDCRVIDHLNSAKLGLCGMTTANRLVGRAHLKPFLKPHNAFKLAVLMLGTNDALPRLNRLTETQHAR